MVAAEGAHTQTGHVDALHHRIHPTPTTQGFLDAIQIRQFTAPFEIIVRQFASTIHTEHTSERSDSKS
jgi:hypothetical protein